MTTADDRIALHRNLLRQAWALVPRNAERLAEASDRWYDDAVRKWREPLQLLVASLIYVNEVLRLGAINEAGFHKPYSDGAQDDWQRFVRLAEPPDCANREPPVILRHMHLASASVRVNSALFHVHRFGLESPLTECLKKGKGDDWDRATVYERLDKAISLGCCANGPLPENDDSLRVCLAVVLAHRDQFGHGEVASGAGYKQRQQIREIYECRVAEAQLRLIRSALNRLTEGDSS